MEKDINSIRQANLILVTTGRGASATLAKNVGVEATYISNWKKGKSVMSEGIARKIETACGLPFGWMDSEHSEPALVSAMSLSTDDIADLKSTFPAIIQSLARLKPSDIEIFIDDLRTANAAIYSTT